MLIKLNDRSARKPLRCCGTLAYYWAKDALTGTRVPVDVTPQTQSVAKGAELPAGTASHFASCTGKRNDSTVTGPVPTPLPTDDTTPAKDEAVVTVPTVVATVEVSTPSDSAVTVATAQPTVPSAAPDAVAEAMRTLFGTFAPSVDESKVRAIVAEAVADIVAPTRTVVLRSHDDVPRVIDNSHPMLADVIRRLQRPKANLLMVGSAGTGKSTIAHQAADALGLPYYCMSLSPQTSEAKVFGYMQATGEYVRTLFREAYEHGGVFNFDELDNAHPSILAAINGALANGHAAFPDGMVKRHQDFRAVGTANTYGRGADRKYVGRQALDAATLDRFKVITVEIDETLETSLCLATGLDAGRVRTALVFVRKVRSNVADHGMPVVISPRGAVGLCEDLHDGFEWNDAVAANIRKGLSDADWTKAASGARAGE